MLVGNDDFLFLGDIFRSKNQFNFNSIRFDFHVCVCEQKKNVNIDYGQCVVPLLDDNPKSNFDTLILLLVVDKIH